MTTATGEAGFVRRGWSWDVARSWWFWGCAVAALVASPMLFASTLVVGGACLLAVLAFRRARPVALAAIGAGLVVGSLPYLVLTLLHLAGLR